MNLKNLSDHELHTRTLQKEDHIRMETIHQLWHLRENERRMLYAKMGYKDLKEYCVKELKLSEGSAWRRINGMRTLQEVPEVENKIQSGELTLTQITKASSHFREVKASTSEKQEILQSLVNQSTRQTELILAEMKPAGFSPVPEVREKPLKGRKLEITLVIDDELQNELEEIQILLGKKLSKVELLKLLVKDKLTLLKKDLSRKEKCKSINSNRVSKSNQILKPIQLNKNPIPSINQNVYSVAEKIDAVSDRFPCTQHSQHKAQPSKIARNNKNLMKRSRYISIKAARAVRLRDQHQCQYHDPVSGRQCSARFHLEIDHIVPFARQGSNELTNLRLLCSNHNKLYAIRSYSRDKMKLYVPSIF